MAQLGSIPDTVELEFLVLSLTPSLSLSLTLPYQPILTNPNASLHCSVHRVLLGLLGVTVMRSFPEPQTHKE